MLYGKNEYINNIFKLMNESIDYLLNEQGVIYTPKGINKKTIESEVIEDSDTRDLYDETNDKYYIKLSDAKEIKNDAKVGDIIEQEVIDTESSENESLEEYLLSDDVSLNDLQEIFTSGKLGKMAGSRGFKTLVRIGKKPFILTGSSIKIIKSILSKKKRARYKTKDKYSMCGCLELTEDGIDENGNLDKKIFKQNISDQPETIREKLIDGYDFCVHTYGKYINKEKDRTTTKVETCPVIKKFYKKGESLMDDLLNKLEQSYEIKGRNKKDIDKTEKVGDDTSIGEKIGRYKYITVNFDNDIEVLSLPLKFKLNEGDNTFKILKNFRDKYKNTLMLEKSSNIYVMSFENAKLQKSNDGSIFKCKSRSNCENNGSDRSNNANWSGKIKELKK